MKELSPVGLCLWLTVAGATPGWADITTNLASMADTSLFETAPDNNLGGLPDFPAGTTSGGAGQPFRSRGLLKFDLTQIPANATITSASLTLKVVKKPGGPGSTFEVCRVLKDWGEGTGQASSAGSPATPGEATWNNRFHPSTPWTPAGGGADVDYVAAFSATNFVDALGSYTYATTPGLVADVQAWVNNPGTNFGWMVLTSDESIAGTARRFASRQSLSGAPRLTIAYTVATPPSPPSISSFSLIGNQFHFFFTANSSQTYAVEYRGLGDIVGTWSVLTNISARVAATSIEVVDTLDSTNRCYRIRTL